MKYKKHHVTQQGKSDCGLASVSVILKKFNIEHSYSFLKDLHYTNDEYSIKDIVLLFKKVNINCRTFKHVGEDLLSSINEIETPCIALVSNQERNHYIVIHEVHNKTLLISDPNEKKQTKINFNKFKELSTGIFILPIIDGLNLNDSEKTKYKSNFNISEMFKQLFIENKKEFITIILLSIVFILINAMNSYFFKLIIDYFIPKKALNELNIFLITFILINLLFTSFGYLRSQIIVKMSNKIDLKIASDFFGHLIKIRPDFHSKRSSGELISRFDDSIHIRETLNKTAIGNVLDVSISLIAGSLLFFLNKKIFVFTLIACISFMIISLLFYPLIEKRVKLFLESKARVNSFMVQFLSNMESIFSFNKSSYFINNVTNRITDEQDALIKLRTIENQSGAIKSLLLNIFFLLIIFNGSYEIIKGNLTIGELVLYVTLLNFVISSVNNLVDFQIDFQEAMVAVKRFADILEYPLSTNGKFLFEKLQNIKISKLKFGYNLGTITIELPDLNIKKGEKIALIGKSGSGKSTITKIIAKLIDCDDNQVFINGVDINKHSTKNLREKITYVGSQPLMFDGTLFENICMGFTADEMEIKKAVRITKLEDLIHSLSAGIYTRVYEDGGNLSSGQKQRINLARALIQKPELLILDETLSNVDQETVNSIMEELYKSDLTIIYISHKELQHDRFDQVINIDSLNNYREIPTPKNTIHQKETFMSFQNYKLELESKFESSNFYKDISLIVDQEVLFELISNQSEDLEEFILRYEKEEEPKLTCGILTLNEEKNIRRVLDSVVGEFDQIIVLDTGSTDKTLNIINQEYNNIELHSRNWKYDFSFHRNEIIELSHNDWIYFIDADNVFLKENKSKLKRIAKLVNFLKVDVVLSPVIYEYDRTLTTDNRRFFSSSTGIRFNGVVHEEPLLPNGKIPVSLNMKVEITHDGYTPEELEQKKKKERNYLLETRMIEQEPNNPKWYYYLARSLYHLSPKENAQKCLHYLEKGFTLYEISDNKSYYLQNLLLQISINMDMANINRAKILIPILEQYNEQLVDVHFYKTLVLFNETRMEIANFLYKSFQSIKINETYFSLIDPRFNHIYSLFRQIANSLELNELQDLFSNEVVESNEHQDIPVPQK
ncbi:ABC transporter transmembrane domain-containing protein [Neobacillus terrae]|uniref:ABC transporter transmembrane domain-containing protein n=1 Tax=Neobacillus terrae TaxID=3034837 RepID=UPI001407C5AE|nr:ABC transporter transmembrane domain-containing protein [Neobacillus terrae]NHM33286.1 ATP-binding cassette domain-containing protein [Neobacillus terrae]